MANPTTTPGGAGNQAGTTNAGASNKAAPAAATPTPAKPAPEGAGANPPAATPAKATEKSTGKSTGKSNGKSTDKTTTTATVPGLLTLRVLQQGGNAPVSGLFIAFKLKPIEKKKGEEKKEGEKKEAAQTEEEKKEQAKKAEAVAHVMSISRDAELKKLEKENKKDRYDEILKHYEKQATESVADPAEEFVLGITDVEGYLEPVYEHSNPWRDREQRLEPDTFKFAVGEEFLALYIRHPSADLARAVTRALNKEAAGRPDVNFAEEAVWGSRKPNLQSFVVEKGSGEKGEQFVIHLPNEAKSYVPLWEVPTKLADGTEVKQYRWWLYHQMPHADVDSVKQQVEELITVMGALKYPVTGSQEFPYSVERVYAEINRIEKNPKNVAKDLRAGISTYHGALHAAVARFQEQVKAGEAFAPSNWAEAQELYSWASHVGKVVPPEKVKESFPPLEHLGICGPTTLAQLHKWKTNGWLKPREHLVTIGLAKAPKDVKPPYAHVYMLGRGAFAIRAWSGLAECFGALYNIWSGHTFRNLAAGGGRGAIKNSIHKSGLAIDLAGGGLRRTQPWFPVRFESEFRRVPQKETRESLQRDLQNREEALNKLKESCGEEKAKSEAALAKANEAKSEMAARHAAMVNPSKTQLNTNKAELVAADKAIKNATTNLSKVEAANAKKLEAAKKARDTAEENLEEYLDEARHDAYRTRERWSMRFRLYAQSNANVFAKEEKTRAAAVQEVRKRIAAWAGLPLPEEGGGPSGAAGEGNKQAGSNGAGGVAPPQLPAAPVVPFADFEQPFYAPDKPFYEIPVPQNPTAGGNTNSAAGLPDGQNADGEFLAYLRNTYFKNVDRKEVDVWLQEQFAPTAKFAAKLLRLSPQELVDQYFRPTVTQWKPNFYEFDGGSDYANAHGPNDFDDDFPAAGPACAWVNLTRLAYGCQMHRISPHRDEVREQTLDQQYFEDDKKKKKVKPPPPRQAFPVNAYLQWGGRDTEHKSEDMVIAIEDITANENETAEPDRKSAALSTFAYNPATYEIEFHQRVTGEKSTECVAKILAKDVDAAFLKAWRPALMQLDSPVYNGDDNNAVYRPLGMQFAVVLNGLNAERAKALEELRKILRRGSFAKKRFWVVKAGSLLLPEGSAAAAAEGDEEESDAKPAEQGAKPGGALSAGAVLTGAALADAVEEAEKRLAELDETLKKKAKQGPKAASAKVSAEKGAKVTKDKVKQPKTWTVEDWSFLVQPIFTLREPAEPAAAAKPSAATNPTAAANPTAATATSKPEKAEAAAATTTAKESAPSTPTRFFLPDQLVMLPARRDSGGLEWWHYQHNSVGKVSGWRDLLRECGYSDNILRVPDEGCFAPSAEPVHIGGGYSEGSIYSELDGQPWTKADIEQEPPNFDTEEDEALEKIPEGAGSIRSAS